jgi:lysophospholipase L1-like esterase
MKQAEQQYAEALIKQYKSNSSNDYITINYAINDVMNTIEAIKLFDKYDIPTSVEQYYQTVLTILKEMI